MKLFNHPLLCNYYLTYRCNAKCHFCDIWQQPSPYVAISDFEKNLIDLQKLGVRVIDFTGGEPLLHRQLGEMLTLAKRAGFITTVTTNCLLYPKYAYKIHKKVDMLHFSLDSPHKLAHDQSRGVSCYDHVIESIQIAHDLDEKPDILFTITNDNINRIKTVYDNICVPNKLILILNPLFQYNAVGGGVDPIQFPTLRKWAKQPDVYINEGFLDLRANGGNQINNPICKAGSTTIVITPENKLRLPCYHLGAKEFEINNRLFELWHSAEVQEWINQEGRLPNCQGCAINCYMQPSFAYEYSQYFRAAFPSTVKYSLEKWIYA